MEKPVLFTKRELIAPVNQALAKIDEIKSSTSASSNKISLQGSFVLAVSSFEISLIDCLEIIFKHYPGKLDAKADAGLKIGDIIEGDGIKTLIARRLMNISYKNIEDILIIFADLTEINKGAILTNLDKLREIKATRNLLIHNNLKPNTLYEETAGRLKRSPQQGSMLALDFSYMIQSVQTVSETLTSIKTELEARYADFTRLRAINALFKYLLPTPIMILEDEFEIIAHADTIGMVKETSRRQGLSYSEKFIYDLWSVHVSHVPREIPSSIFFSLGYGVQKRIAFLMQNIDILKS